MMGQPSPPNQIYFQPPQSVPGIRFRLARRQDLETLWTNCYPEMIWDQFLDHFDYLLRWQANGRCYILIAQTTKTAEIIGSGQIISRPDKAEIAELVVQQVYQNQGIGTAMIEILTRLADEQNWRNLEIGAAVQNDKALRLYRRLGFGNDRLIQLPGAEEAIFLSKQLP